MKHSHYKKSVAGLEFIDVYRVLSLYGVTDPCIQHACKKLLVTGNRGHKNTDQDIQDAIDTLTRWQEMRAEEVKTDSVKRAHDILAGIAKPNTPIVLAPDLEPASEIDDESERQQLVQQSGEMAEHVYPAVDAASAFGPNGECKGCTARNGEPHGIFCKYRWDNRLWNALAK